MPRDVVKDWIVIILLAFAFMIPFAICLIGILYNRTRIRKYIESNGGTVTKIQWSPFGPGWIGGGRSDMVYKVYYQDRDGNEHHAYCRTGMATGVTFTEDKIKGEYNE